MAETSYNATNLNRVTDDLLGQLRSRFIEYGEGFVVVIYKDPAHWKDVIVIWFMDERGNRHRVVQEEPHASLWGYVGLSDVTIATIMLLLG